MTKRENQELARTADELRSRFEERLQFKDETIRNLNCQIDDMQALLQSAQRPGRGVEQQLEELRRENGELRDQLKHQFVRELGDEALSREVAAIRDPGSFAAVKSILARMNRQREENVQLNQKITLSGDMEKSLTDLNTKYKQKETEIKNYKAEIKSLMIQKDFLQREYNFLQKKLSQGKSVGPVVTQKEPIAVENSTSAEFYKNIVRDICAILKIKDESSLVGSIKIIEEAYQLLPSLQGTVENIFKVVYEGNIFETPLNSYDDSITKDLSDAVENWSTNLQDYKNLVDGLLEILEVESDENKTVSYILETISRMRNRSGSVGHASRSDLGRSDSEQALIMLKEMLRENTKEGVLDSVASLQKRLEIVMTYLPEVKARLELSSSTSDEVTFSKLLRVLALQHTK